MISGYSRSSSPRFERSYDGEAAYLLGRNGPAQKTHQNRTSAEGSSLELYQRFDRLWLSRKPRVPPRRPGLWKTPSDRPL